MQIKNKIKEWLGITKLEQENKRLQSQLKTWGVMGVDLSGNERDKSFIVVASNLNGGLVKVINARFGSMTEALDLIKGLQVRYEIREPIKDLPRNYRF